MPGQASSEEDESDETNTEAVVRTMNRLGASLDAAAAAAAAAATLDPPPPPAEKRIRNGLLAEHFREGKSGLEI